MATPPFVINEALPGDTDVVSQHPANARVFRDVTEDYLNTDHDFNTGHHARVGLVEVSAPSGTANTGWLYAKDVAGATELFWMDDDGTEKQLTSGGKLNVVAADIPVNSVDGTKLSITSEATGAILQFNGTDWVVVLPGTAGHVLKSQGAGSAVVYAAESLSGTLTAGTPLVQNPVATDVTVTQAHGLGVVPNFLTCVLENTSGELGYSVGDKIEFSTLDQSGGFPTFFFLKDATNVVLLAAVIAGTVVVPHKTTRALTQITNANWKITVTPYKLNP